MAKFVELTEGWVINLDSIMYIRPASKTFQEIQPKLALIGSDTLMSITDEDFEILSSAIKSLPDTSTND